MNQLKMNTNLLHLSFRSIHRGSCIRVRVHVCGDNRVIQPDYLVGKRKTDGRLLHQFYCYQYHHLSSIITAIIIGVAFSILGSYFFNILFYFRCHAEIRREFLGIHMLGKERR